MTMIRKRTAFFIALLLLSVVLAGCGADIPTGGSRDSGANIDYLSKIWTATVLDDSGSFIANSFYVFEPPTPGGVGICYQVVEQGSTLSPFEWIYQLGQTYDGGRLVEFDFIEGSTVLSELTFHLIDPAGDQAIITHNVGSDVEGAYTVEEVVDTTEIQRIRNAINDL